MLISYPELFLIYRSLNHFAHNKEFRVSLKKIYTKQWCHCSACKYDLPLCINLQMLDSNSPVVSFLTANTNGDYDKFEEVCFNRAREYLNANRSLTYLTKEMGLCILTILLYLRKNSETYSIDRAISIHSKLSMDNN